MMAQQEMAALEVTIRETMTYQSPKEMGALFSAVHEMKDVIEGEQEKARKKRDADVWLRQERERLSNEKVAYLVATTLFLLYLWLIVSLLSRTGRA